MTANRIIAHVFLQPSLQLVNEAAIEQLVADHPYFSAARLLLARKVYQQTGNLQHPAVRKALLYVDQHHYAYQLITEEQVLQVVENRVAAVIPEDTLPAEAANGLPENDTIVSAIAATEILPVIEDHIAPVLPADDLPAPLSDSHHVSEAIAQETENIALEVENIATEALASTTIADFEPENTLPENTHPDSTTVVLPPPVETPSASEESASEEKQEEETAGPIKIFPMATATEETELIFQPLYTDDYFAYKRLKNPEEADALNEQGAAEMKSFTSWLRQMKDNFAGKSSKDWYHQQLHRIYEEDEEPEVSETVEKMAMDSIVFNNDIVSETLAEIWVRQQQYGNAIKIYQKLSLLNPDKNAYFAQKIVELKSKTDKK